MDLHRKAGSFYLSFWAFQSRLCKQITNVSGDLSPKRDCYVPHDNQQILFAFVGVGFQKVCCTQRRQLAAP